MPPDILDHPTSTDMVVREGSTVTLTCAASGSPNPSIVWRREAGEAIVLNDGSQGNTRVICANFLLSEITIIRVHVNIVTVILQQKNQKKIFRRF